jgi:hypothetical protein
VLRCLTISAVLALTVSASRPCPAAIEIAQGGCTEACRAQYNQCRIATKGSASCDAQFAACMQRCISSRGR